MDKKLFNTLLAKGDFENLFISELGWDKPRGAVKLPPIHIDDITYQIKTIADRNNYKVLLCEVERIPTASEYKKLDLKVKKFANDYILILKQRQGFRHLWLVPVNKVEKRDLVAIDYNSIDQTNFLLAKIESLDFGFQDEQITITDVRSKVNSGFIVNSEKITKDFYAGFKKQHKAFVKQISGIDDHITSEKNRNKQWYTSVMLNRLMFCYFIQKKGFLNFDVDYLRNRLKIVRENEGAGRFYNFYRSFLRRLFHDGLNAPKHSSDFEKLFGKIPYLNGGMFDEHQIEKEYPDIDIPDEAFLSLFEFFDKWNWHLDTRLTASGKDINPDVLGYIFEQYINDRAQMGAYYTKEDITEYIGRNCILPFLFDKVKSTTKESPKYFEPDGYVWKTLQESEDKYIFEAVKKGYTDRASIPQEISRGIITEEMKKEYSETPVGELHENHVPLSELRKNWNTRTPDKWGLPNEIWRETIERIQRCGDILEKIKRGEIRSINDFITYNLDIRSFAADLIANGDNKFVKWFYKSLQEVTILDPTCGSGAFLFAAMNILEPLYEICIDRMQEFNRENPYLFKEELSEITSKYRSNIQYFIFKSIILRNLYGVDIMVEATEIAKLRLFLKMVAVVDVDKRAENLGLDPLPDIDFNIRCGNTLVGYANKEQLDKDLSDNYEDFLKALANEEFKKEIDDEMKKVAAAYKLFVYQQLRQEENMAAFKQAKHDLQELLKSLNSKLNHRLYSATAPQMRYDEWLKTHQPFHWLAEFYQIIEGNGGFDVIIGNPPYVVYNPKNFEYCVNGYNAESNLYAFCIERSFSLTNSCGHVSMIVPVSIVNGSKFESLRDMMEASLTHISSYSGDTHPGTLFEGVQQNLAIFFADKKSCKDLYTTRYIRFFNSERANLFGTINYCEADITQEGYFKQNSEISKQILQKIRSHPAISNTYFAYSCRNSIYMKTTSGSQYKLFFKEPPFFSINGVCQIASSFKPLYYNEKIFNSWVAIALHNSNLFNIWWVGLSDGRNVTSKEVGTMPVAYTTYKDSELIKLAKYLMIDLERNSTIVTYNKAKGITKYAQFVPRKSKSVIDEIDTVLARHYGFTEEELDFIINYDIKYRMGDELNNSDE